MADTHSAATDIRIARLKPVGREAEETFSRLIESDDLSNFHKQFMFITPYDSATSSSENPFDADDESFRQPQPRREDTPKKLWAGHYLLSTDCTGKAPPSIGWRVGKGTSKLEDRGVDFLLIPPGLPSRKVAVYHALIQFHPKSGVLLIKGVSKTLPVEYYVDNKPLLLYAGDVHVLYQAVNRFRLGKLEYHFVYEDLDNDQYTDYVRIRNEALHAAGAEIPSPRLLALPRRPHMKHGDIILHESLNSGAFGLVCAAVDARTGAPLAMKEIWIKNKNMLKDNGLKAERKVATQFTDVEGLLQAHTVQCEHGQPEPCGNIPERFYMTFPLAQYDFSMHDWSATSLDTILALLKGPLRGLKALHEAGWMHRDISPKNILVMSLSPPTALPCDYGKARQTQWHIDTHIGPIAYLAPEVDGTKQYNNKIDIWGIGYVCCEILIPQYQHDFRAKSPNTPPNHVWHKGAMDMLLRYAKKGPAERNFADLIHRMLAWNPADRPTAAQALQHPCMPPDPPSPKSSPEPEAPKAKSQKKDDRPRSDAEGHSGDTEPLTPGRRPPSFHSSAQEPWIAALRAQAKEQAGKDSRRS